MKKGDVYRDAAMSAFLNPPNACYSCNEISHVVLGRYCVDSERDELPEVILYDELLSPNHKRAMDAWGYFWGDTDIERQQCRVLALLLMAEIVDSGDA